MDNNNKGIFYVAVGISAILVAIIGATFAFFTASASNDNTITGTAATAGLALEVTGVSSQNGSMVPQLTSTLSTAIDNTNSCIDANGNLVCKTYTISIRNTGTSTVNLYGQISFAYTGDSTFANLKWALITYGVGDAATTIGTVASTSTASTQGNLVNGATIAANTTNTYYIVVWIEEKNRDQSTEDKGSFTGTIAFTSADGGGITSTFK